MTTLIRSCPFRVMTSRPSGIITLTTDFGLQDPSVGIMKAALLTASEKSKVIDLTHEVEPHNVAMGAFMLWTAANRFPAGTVHVGMVDTRIGPERQLLAVSAHNQYWLTPDNNLVGAVLATAPVSEVRSLDLEHLRLQRSAETMDGRDLLARPQRDDGGRPACEEEEEGAGRCLHLAST